MIPTEFEDKVLQAFAMSTEIKIAGGQGYSIIHQDQTLSSEPKWIRIDLLGLILPRPLALKQNGTKKISWDLAEAPGPEANWFRIDLLGLIFLIPSQNSSQNRFAGTYFAQAPGPEAQVVRLDILGLILPTYGTEP